MEKWLSGLRWLTAIVTVLLALLLSWQCIDLYVTGNSPDNLDANGVHITPVFTVDKVSQRLTALLPAFGGYALIALLTLAVQAGAAPSAKTKRLTAPAESRLRLMKARVAELPDAAKAEERLRCRTWWTAGLAAAVCTAGALTYLLNRDNFTSWELEGVMGQMLLHVGPWVLIVFGVLMAAALVCGRSMERGLEALKGALKSAPAVQTVNARPAVGIVRVALLLAAIGCIVWGVCNGGLYDVLVKAINICTECIGLG